MAEADGTPDNKSAVTLPFTAAVQVLNPSGIHLSARLKDPTAGKRTVNLPVLSAVAGEQGVVVTTGQQVPAGASLLIDAGTLADGAGTPLKKLKAKVKTSPLAAADFLLVNRPLRPTNINLFTNDAFPDASLAPQAEGTGPTEDEARKGLAKFLAKRVKARQLTKAEAKAAVARFDADDAKAIVPSSNLRAALLSLAGTAAEGAIDTVLTSNNQSGKPYAKIDFDPSTFSGGAQALIQPDGSVTVKLSTTLQGESFQVLGSVLSHEVMHQDNSVGQIEESLADSASAITWFENVLVDPSLVERNTFLTRVNNTLSLALLNSGNKGYAKVGLGGAPGLQANDTLSVNPKVFAGGGVEVFQSLDHYARTRAALVGNDDINSSGNSYLTSFVSSVDNSNITDDGFSRNTRDLIDQGQQVIGTAEVFKLAKALGLTTAPA